MGFLKRISTSFMRGPVFIVGFGLIFFGIGAVLTYQQRSFERQGAQAQGEVISLASSCDDDGCTYAPVVRFTTGSGDTVTFDTNYYSSPPAYHTGQRVTVIYSPEEPEKAVIQGQGQLFRIIFMGIGGIIIVVGLWMFFSNIRDSYLKG